MPFTSRAFFRHPATVRVPSAAVPAGDSKPDMPLSQPPPVQAITLDVGHTLIFPHPSLGEVYASVGRRHGLNLAAGPMEQRFENAWRECQARQTGLIYGTSHEEALAFWYQVNRTVLADAGLRERELRALVEDLYRTFGQAHAWRVNPGLASLLAASRQRGLRLALVSNWDLRLRPLLAELNLVRWANPVLISAEVGCEKPAAELFNLAIRGLGVPADQILHVGDTWTDDVLGASACGMQAAWLNPAARPLPTSPPRVHDLRRLEDAVRLFGQDR
jgi:putative hydrolase of the HAD superfamily